MTEKKRRIYFDHAATTPLDRAVFEKMSPYFTSAFGNADSLHAYGREAKNALDSARDTLSGLIGANPSEVYFTSGGTESDNWAILGGAECAKEGGRNRVLISAIEHHAVLSAAQRLEERGYSVGYIPVDEGGRVELNAFKALLTPEVGLVAVMAANNETGVIQPVRELAALTHENGSLFFTDAVHAAPYMPIDVKEWGVDMLSLSAHKFYGGRGAGALFVRKGVRIGRLVTGGEQERGLRGGTSNIPAIVGCAEAYVLAHADLEKNNAKIARLKTLFLEELTARVSGVQVNGAEEYALPSVLNIRIEGVDNAAFLRAMDLAGVALSAGAACASADVKPSHVLTAMGRSEKEAKECVRFSFGKDNTEEEILLGAAFAAETVNRLRKVGASL